MFGAILAGTNACAKGRNAVVIAHALARITGDRLVLVAVRSDPLVEIPAIHLEDTTPLAAELARELHRVRDELAPEASVAVQSAVSVAEGLRIAARRERAALVVVGVAPRHGRKRPFESDDAVSILHHVPCSLLVVSEEQEPPGSIERIVVGLVDSADAAAACATAADLARRIGASLRFVTVVDHHPVPGLEKVQAERQEAAEALIRRAVAESGLTSASGAVLHGADVDALTSASREADLLVLGSHQRHNTPARRLRSTLAGVLHAAHCPVLVAIAPSREAGGSPPGPQEAARLSSQAPGGVGDARPAPRRGRIAPLPRRSG
jgi:nucleotide-binding universal stress UspA family protein